MKKNTGAKIFIWMIIILMFLALTISFLLPIIAPLISGEDTSQSNQINIQDLIDSGQITIETATPDPSNSDMTLIEAQNEVGNDGDTVDQALEIDGQINAPIVPSDSAQVETTAEVDTEASQEKQ